MRDFYALLVHQTTYIPNENNDLQMLVFCCTMFTILKLDSMLYWLCYLSSLAILNISIIIIYRIIKALSELHLFCLCSFVVLCNSMVFSHQREMESFFLLVAHDEMKFLQNAIHQVRTNNRFSLESTSFYIYLFCIFSSSLTNSSTE